MIFIDVPYGPNSQMIWCKKKKKAERCSVSTILSQKSTNWEILKSMHILNIEQFLILGA